MCERQLWLDTEVWTTGVTKYRLWTAAVIGYRCGRKLELDTDVWMVAVTRYRCVDGSCD